MVKESAVSTTSNFEKLILSLEFVHAQYRQKALSCFEFDTRTQAMQPVKINALKKLFLKFFVGKDELELHRYVKTASTLLQKLSDEKPKNVSWNEYLDKNKNLDRHLEISEKVAKATEDLLKKNLPKTIVKPLYDHFSLLASLQRALVRLEQIMKGKSNHKKEQMETEFEAICKASQALRLPLDHLEPRLKKLGASQNDIVDYLQAKKREHIHTLSLYIEQNYGKSFLDYLLSQEYDFSSLFGSRVDSSLASDFTTYLKQIFSEDLFYSIWNSLTVSEKLLFEVGKKREAHFCLLIARNYFPEFASEMEKSNSPYLLELAWKEFFLNSGIAPYKLVDEAHKNPSVFFDKLQRHLQDLKSQIVYSH